MKYLITIFSLLIFTEIQFCLSSKNEDGPDITNNQNRREYTDLKVNESTQDGENSILPDMFALASQENSLKKPLASPNEARKSEVETPTNIENMKRITIARCDNAMKNAKLALGEVMADVRTLQENAEKERDEDHKKNYDHYAKAESIVAILRRKASKKFAEAMKHALNEYNKSNQAKPEATEGEQAALEALEEEFAKEQALLRVKKQELENKYQEIIDKAREEKETALEIAGKKRKQAAEKYTKAIDNRRISREDRQKAEKEYEVETYKYDDAVELAEIKWQNVLDDLGIGCQFRAAEEKLLEKLEQAKKKAGLDYEGTLKDHNGILEDPKMKLQEADRLAKEELSKAEDECNEILKEAAKQVNITYQINENKWRRMRIHTDELLKRAEAEFSKAEKAAINEHNLAWQKIKQVERDLAKENNTKSKTPEKINQQGSKPRRKNVASLAQGAMLQGYLRKRKI